MSESSVKNGRSNCHPCPSLSNSCPAATVALESSVRLWSDLPPDLWLIILQKLKDFTDILRCGMVCISLQSLITTQHHLKYFLLVTNINGSKLHLLNHHPSREYCFLFNIQTKFVYEIPPLPELKWSSVSNSSYGWLLIFSSDGFSLLNPLTRARIQLPPEEFKAHPESLRVVTSTSPSNPTCLILAVHHYKPKLAFCRPGETTWNTSAKVLFLYGGLSDIIFYKGDFYAIAGSETDKILRIHCVGKSLTVEKMLVRPIEHMHNDTSKRVYGNYLVEWMGHLLLVIRTRYKRKVQSPYSYVNPTFYKKTRFQAYRMDWDKKEWIKVKNLGDSVIFLRRFNSKSLVLSGSSITGDHYRTNCIYFVDDDDMTASVSMSLYRSKYDPGVYDMETKCVKRVQMYKSPPLPREFAFPVWLNPLEWITP